VDTAVHWPNTKADHIYAWRRDSWQALKHGSVNDHSTGPRNESSLLTRILALLLSVFWSIAIWLFIQFLAVCAYWEGSYRFVFLWCVVFNAWTTVDIVSMRIVNDPLIGADEKKMGFGQVLPLVLVLSVFLPSMGGAGNETKSKTWGIRRAQTLMMTQPGSDNQRNGSGRRANGDTMSAARGLADPAADADALELRTWRV
ncbi:hypothetical protein V8F06_012699, partial [Rhypophila decipiens]